MANAGPATITFQAAVGVARAVTVDGGPATAPFAAADTTVWTASFTNAGPGADTVTETVFEDFDVEDPTLMAITYVGSFAKEDDLGSPRATLPSGLQVGDQGWLVGICVDTTTLSPPAGWTAPSGWTNPKGGGNARFYLWQNLSLTASDSGATIQVTASATNKVTIAGTILRGAAGPDVTPVFQAHSTSSGTYTCPAAISATADAYGVCWFGARGTGPFSNWVPATGLTERQDLTATGGGATTLQLCGSAGSIGGAGTVWGPFSETNLATSNGGGITLLVKPSATGSSGGGGGAGTGSNYPTAGHNRTAASYAGDDVARMQGAVSYYGPFQGGGGTYHPVGSARPLDSTEDTWLANQATLGPLWIKWKPYPSGQDWAYTAAGSYDATLDAAAADFAAVAPTEIWLTIHHEPENDVGPTGFSAANYVGMWQRVRARFDAAGVTNVKWVWMLMGSTVAHATVLPSLWPGDAYVDVVAMDPYIQYNGTPSNLPDLMLASLDWLAANEASNRHWGYLSKPQAFGEWGTSLGGGDDTDVHCADAIDAVTAALPQLAARNVVRMVYFDGAGHKINTGTVASAAYQRFKDATEAGQTSTTGPVVGAGAALAGDSATATTNTLTFTLPAGWQPGDYATVWLSSNSNPTVSTTPAGWVLAEGPVNISTTQVGWRYTKRLAAGETNPSWVLSLSVRPVGVMVVLRGINATTAVHVSTGLTATSSGTSHAAPAITTTQTSYLLSVWLFRWSTANTAGTNYATAPGTHTIDGSASSNSAANPGAGALVAHLTSQPVPAGVYGPYSATVVDAATGLCEQIAILPGATTPTTQVALVGTATTAGIASGTLDVTYAPPTPPPPPVGTFGPGVTVQIAPTSTPMDPNPVWIDLPTTANVTGHYVMAPITITAYGRPDEFSEATATVITVPLWNADGAFTAGRSGPYGILRVGTRIRIIETYNSVSYQRFQGHVNGWPVAWPVGGGTAAQAEITATDRLKRLGRPGDLRSMAEEEILLDVPAAYHPLSEESGSTSCGSIATAPQGALGLVDFHAGVSVGGSVAIGGGSGPGPDALPTPSFDPASSAAGEYLAADLLTPVGGAAGFSVRASFRTSETAVNRAICSWRGVSGSEVRLSLDTQGRVVASRRDAATDLDGQIYAIASLKTFNDDHDHDVAFVESVASSLATAKLYVDGAQVATAAARVSFTTFPRLSRLLVGSDGDTGQLWQGSISHVAAFNQALPTGRVVAHYHAGIDGLAGERSDTRLHRICGWAGIPASDRAFDVGDKLVSGQATSGKQPTQAMAEVVSAEQGVLYVRGDGKLVFHSRSRRYNAAAAVTLNATQTGQVGLDTSYPGDDFGVQNDVSVSRTGGSTQRAINQAAIDGQTGVGLYRDSLEVASATDDAALQVAFWRVAQYGFPLQRLPTLTVPLALLAANNNTTLVGQLLAADISSVIHLSNLPGQAPATSDDQVIEGWTETIGTGVWQITFTTSPHSVNRVFILGTSALGGPDPLAL